MPLVGAGLGDDIDDAVREAAVLGAVVVGLDAELIDGVGVGLHVAGVAETGHIGAAIKVVAGETGVGDLYAAVDEHLLLRIAEREALGVGLHARDEREKIVDVAVDDGE